MQRFPIILISLLLIVFSLSHPRLGMAETTLGTEITTLPYEINTPGIYYLNHDFKQEFPDYVPAIQVAASNVTIDMNGHFISVATPNAYAQTYGITSTDRTHVTVRNGTLTGFAHGIEFGCSGYVRPRRQAYACLIEDMLISDGSYLGISINADDSQVKHCRVTRLTGNPGGFFAGSLGICFLGSGGRIVENDISDMATVNQYPSFGIYCTGDSGGAMIIGNRVDGTDNAIYCNYDSNGVYRDNLVINSPAPCYALYWQDGGGNNF